MKILNLDYNQKMKGDTSSTKYVEENTWELMESLEYRQSRYSGNTNTFNITLLICIIFVLGITCVCVYKWYTKNKFALIKI